MKSHLLEIWWTPDINCVKRIICSNPSSVLSFSSSSSSVKSPSSSGASLRFRVWQRTYCGDYCHLLRCHHHEPILPLSFRTSLSHSLWPHSKNEGWHLRQRAGAAGDPGPPFSHLRETLHWVAHAEDHDDDDDDGDDDDDDDDGHNALQWWLRCRRWWWWYSELGMEEVDPPLSHPIKIIVV